MGKIMTIPGDKTELASAFMLAFGGQFVTITTSLSVNVSDGDKMESFPINFEGIVLDRDDQFIYLGESINEISSAVERSKIVHIQIKEELTVVDQIFDNMPDPKKEEIN
jgi:hypothetical protein